MIDDPELSLSLIVVLLALGCMAFTAVMFARANGRRPFLVGYMGISVLLVVSSLDGLGEPPSPLLAAVRMGASGLLIATLIWATFPRSH